MTFSLTFDLSLKKTLALTFEPQNEDTFLLEPEVLTL